LQEKKKSTRKKTLKEKKDNTEKDHSPVCFSEWGRARGAGRGGQNWIGRKRDFRVGCRSIEEKRIKPVTRLKKKSLTRKRGALEKKGS